MKSFLQINDIQIPLKKGRLQDVEVDMDVDADAETNSQSQTSQNIYAAEDR
jgi:hypothetical protein